MLPRSLSKRNEDRYAPIPNKRRRPEPPSGERKSLSCPAGFGGRASSPTTTPESGKSELDVRRAELFECQPELAGRLSGGGTLAREPQSPAKPKQALAPGRARHLKRPT
jgi:hypothetical protein